MARRSLTLDTLVLSSGRAIGAVAAIAITAILTRTLSIDAYATHKQALLLYAFATPLLTLGLPKALYTFIPARPDHARGALLENLTLLLAGGALFALALPLGLAQFAADRFANPALAHAALWMAPYALAMAPMTALGACLVAGGHITPLVRFNLASRLALLVAVALAAVTLADARATLAAHALWATLALAPALMLMIRTTHGGRPTLIGMRAQLAFAIPLGIASLLGTLSTQLDKLIVSAMCTPRDFAIYTTGALELPLIGIITGAMSAVVLPDLTRFHRAGTPEKIIALWQRAMNLALLLLTPAMFAVLLAGPELIIVLFSADYAEAATPLRIYALTLPLRAAVYGSVLMATGHTRQITLSAAFGLALNALLSVIAVRAIGPTGAAWATVATTYAVVAFMLRPMSRALGCRARDLMPWRHIARVIALTAMPAALVWLALTLLSEAIGADAIDAVPPLLRLFAIGGLYAALVAAAYAIAGVATPRDLIRFLRRAPPS